MDLFRLVVLDEAVRAGDWWPRFNEAFYYGYGSLLFHFYAPFGYYLAELFSLLGASLAVAMKLAMAVGILLSGVFMALLARDLFGDYAAACAGVLYVLAPYHLVDVLARHAFGEALAFAWLPLAFWGILGAVRDRSMWHMTAGAVGIFLLLVTHNITAMISAPMLFFWWLYLSVKFKKDGWQGSMLGAAAGAFGLLTAAFFWLPALLETNLIWSEKSLTDEYFQYWKHFVYFKQFFSTMWGHGGSGPGMNDTLPFQLGLAHWVLLGGSVFVFWRCRNWRSHLAVLWVFCLAALAFCHDISRPVWDAVNILAFVQFPWRFLILAAFAASLAGACVAEALKDVAWRNVGPSLALCAVCFAFPAYAPYTSAKHTLVDTQTGKYLRFARESYEKKQALPRYERLEEIVDGEWIRDRLIRATAREDYLPKNVTVLPSGRPAEDMTVENGELIEMSKLGARHYRAKVQMEDEGRVVLHRFWYPGWRAVIDGEAAETQPCGAEGLVGASVGAGLHEIEFRFGSTSLRIISWILSFLGLLALGAVVIFFRR